MSPVRLPAYHLPPPPSTVHVRRPALSCIIRADYTEIICKQCASIDKRLSAGDDDDDDDDE